VYGARLAPETLDMLKSADFLQTGAQLSMAHSTDQECIYGSYFVSTSNTASNGGLTHHASRSAMRYRRFTSRAVAAAR